MAKRLYLLDDGYDSTDKISEDNKTVRALYRLNNLFHGHNPRGHLVEGGQVDQLKSQLAEDGSAGLDFDMERQLSHFIEFGPREFLTDREDTYLLPCLLHRWASTSISMSAISDIRHRHMLFRYRRQICRTEKRHSDIGTLPILTSEFIPISDIEEKKYFIRQIRTRYPWSGKRELVHLATVTVCMYQDVGYKISGKTSFRYPI